MKTLVEFLSSNQHPDPERKPGYYIYTILDQQLYEGPFLTYQLADKRHSQLYDPQVDQDFAIGYRDLDHHFWAVDSQGRRTVRLSR